MKIHSIYIDGYKNLKNMEIFMPEDSSVAAIIGNNGSGKSNILEALTQIFSAVYNEKTVDFRYKICYSIYNDDFQISNFDNVQFFKNGKKVSKQDRRSEPPHIVRTVQKRGLQGVEQANQRLAWRSESGARPVFVWRRSWL